MSSSQGRPKVAVVTGAASGIGRATTERLVHEGWRVLAVDLTKPDPGFNVDQVRSFQADVSKEDDNLAMVAEAVSNFGGLDGLVMSAGISYSSPLLDTPMEVFDRIIAINLRGAALGMRAAIPALRERPGGSIVAISSTHGLAGDAHFAAYCASKHGIVGLVRAMARELGHERIRVNALCPGPTRGTGMSQGIEDTNPAAYRKVRTAVPLGRWAEASECAAAACFLLSDAASFITGAAVPVDGGAISGSGLNPPAGTDQNLDFGAGIDMAGG